MRRSWPRLVEKGSGSRRKGLKGVRWMRRSDAENLLPALLVAPVIDDPLEFLVSEEFEDDLDEIRV